MNPMTAVPLWAAAVENGAHTSLVVRRHHTLRLTDVVGNGNASVLLINHDDRSDRLNIPDTLKAQHVARLTSGHVLMSDMGRSMASIIADDFGGHDCLTGLSTEKSISQAFGQSSYQEARNEYFRNGTDSMLMQLGRWGLDRRELLPCVHFFSRLSIGVDGEIALDITQREQGRSVVLRADMNLLVLVVTAPHALHPKGEYPRSRIRLELGRTAAPRADDPCRCQCAENARALALSDQFFGDYSTTEPGDDQ